MWSYMIGSLAPWSGSITKGVPLSLGSLALGSRENEFDTTSAPASPGFGPCTSQALFPRKRRQCGNEMEAFFFSSCPCFHAFFFLPGFMTYILLNLSLSHYPPFFLCIHHFLLPFQTPFASVHIRLEACVSPTCVSRSFLSVIS